MQVRTALMLCCLGLAGCSASTDGARRVWLPAYALGAIGGGDLDVRDYCPAGSRQELSVSASWATLGVSLATLGVYTPREVTIRCGCDR